MVDSDSLKSTYKRVLENVTDKKASKQAQTSFTIEGSNNKERTKEFELFKNDLELRRELVMIERSRQDKEEIIEIISSEFTSGLADNSIEVFGKRTSRIIFYPMLLTLLTILLLLGLEANKFLDSYKDKI